VEADEWQYVESPHLCVAHLHALRAAADAGRAVPSNLAVLGFGDFDVAAHTSPALSTIRIPGRDIGHATARALLARLSGPTPDTVRSDLGFEIVSRESV
jgi:LacI family gluconate utilization system Gnt-I transcriptional repressor